MKYLTVVTLALVVLASSLFVGTAVDTIGKGGQLYGWAPGCNGLAITEDGKKAYVSFCLDDSLLVVDLPTFTVIGSVNLSSVGNMLSSSSAVLFANGLKLAVANPGTKNVMIINTTSDTVEAVLPIGPCYSDSISVSHNGNLVYMTTGDLYIVNGSDNSYRKISIPDFWFESVEPSTHEQSLLYCIGSTTPYPNAQRVFFTFNLSSNTVERVSNLTSDALWDGTPTRFSIDSNETTAYFGSFNTVRDKGVGNLNVFDLKSFQTLFSTPIECGVSHFAINEEKGKIYIIGFWSGGGAPNTGYIREWDIPTNRVVRSIFVSPSSDQRAIAVDPTNSDYLYMTEGDCNILRKVQISTGQEVQKVKFNKDDISPYALIRGNDVGYIVCQKSRDIFKLNLSSGQLMGTIPLPQNAQATGGYYQDKLYFLGGEHVYCIDPNSGSLVQTFDTNIEMNYALGLTFFNDRMATVEYDHSMIGARLLLFDKNMTLLKSVDLPAEPHGNKVIASPDGSKLYVERGPMGGPTVITVFNSSTLEIINVIEIPATQSRFGATSFLEGDFDEENRILYLCGAMSIYKINMDTDQLVGTLDSIDLYHSLGINGWSCTGVGNGAVLSHTKDKLYVISGDAHSMYVYDIVNSTWMPKITNLKGYFITDTDASSDRKHLFTINQKSDSITMVNLTSYEIEIIELTTSEIPEFPSILAAFCAMTVLAAAVCMTKVAYRLTHKS